MELQLSLLEWGKRVDSSGDQMLVSLSSTLCRKQQPLLNDHLPGKAKSSSKTWVGITTTSASGSGSRINTMSSSGFASLVSGLSAGGRPYPDSPLIESTSSESLVSLESKLLGLEVCRGGEAADDGGVFRRKCSSIGSI